MPSLVGSEMCIRDRVSTQSTWGVVDLIDLGAQDLGNLGHDGAFRQIGGEAADAEGGGRETGAAVRLEHIEDVFALAPGVEEDRQGADIHGVGAQPDQVAGDPIELVEQRADVLGAARHRDAEEFFVGLRPSQVIGDGGGVVHAVGPDLALEEGLVLADLLDAPVQVPDHGLAVADGLALESQLDPEHAVGGRVLGAQVDFHLLVLEHRSLRLGPLEVDAELTGLCQGDAVEHAVAVLAEVDIALAPAHHGIFLAQGMALPVLGAEDAGHVRVVREADAQHVPDLPLHPVGGWVDLGGALGLEPLGDKDAQAQALAAADARQVIDHTECEIRRGRVVGGRFVGQHLVFQLGILPAEFQGLQDGFPCTLR
eukprot:TRINITY_DN11073_c0_g1_i1.p2 TRINITY_DN11073_c0_g1~~TRINITY_DN11073_c0_g1_i1.p2  ORF type:complete len:369 (+),score=42.63 TRINITY_DN11073_c0_g1_i1:92-1198(+)